MKKVKLRGRVNRPELAAIIYDQNILGFNGPRLMTVLLPSLGSDEKVLPSHSGLIENYTSGWSDR